MIAIIPARGGSKGILRKNVKLLNGKPLIAYTIEAALAARNISRVIISTDDKEISKISMDYGAECPFDRPKYLASDDAKSIDVYKYTLDKLEQLEGLSKIEEFIVLQPTSPLRSSADIDNAIRYFREKDADSVVSYCQENHPIKWHKFLNEDGKFENIFEDDLNNRQVNRPTYYPNGAIYVFKRDIINSGVYYTDRSFAYIMDRIRSIDIDDIDDFNYAEYILSRK